MARFLAAGHNYNDDYVKRDSNKSNPRISKEKCRTESMIYGKEAILNMPDKI